MSGPAHFGIGWYTDRRPSVCETTRPAGAAPVCVDVEGTGLLLAPNGCTMGYARLNYVSVASGDDAHVRLSEIEVFTGNPAVAHAQAMSCGRAAHSATTRPSN